MPEKSGDSVSEAGLILPRHSPSSRTSHSCGSMCRGGGQVREAENGDVSEPVAHC